MKPVNVQLSIGEVTQEVKITGRAPVISTESQTISTYMPQATLDKPTLMDSEQQGYYEMFFSWMPGTSANSYSEFAGTPNTFYQGTVEGIQNLWQFLDFDLDSVNTVSIVQMAPAEYARPTESDATIKSGTNDLHASYYMGFYNDACLYAIQNPFSHGQAKGGPCITEWRPFYGVSGPVYIPHVYDGRNKSFFYFGLHRNSPKTTIGDTLESVPTLAMQGGDFSNYPKTVTDPTTGLPFPGNVIPANRISSVAQAIINQFIGNHYTYIGSANSFTDNAEGIGKGSQPTLFYDFRIDENIGSKDILTGTWINQAENKGEYTANQGASPALGGPVFAGNSGRTGKVLSIAETHVFSPNIVNELRIGFDRTFYGTNFTLANFTTPIYGDTTMNAWGLQGITNSPHLTGTPSVTIQNWLASGNQASFEWDTRPLGYNNITFVHGKHTYKVGFSATKLMDDGPGIVVPGSNGPFWGTYTFTGQFTGEPFADFLLGIPGDFGRQTNRSIIDRRMWEFGAFVQDDFRVTPRLTVSYGLRWDKYTVPYDKSGEYYTFDATNDEVVVPDSRGLAAISPAWPVSRFPVVLASQDNYPSKLVNGSYNLDPRLGIAYRLNNRTVIRGGWGYYTGSLRFDGLNEGGPFGLTESFINTAVPTSPSGTQYAWPDPFPSVTPVANVLTATGVAKNYHVAYSLNSQITLEREIFPNWAFRATYLNTLVRDLPWTQNVNSPLISTTPYTQASNPNPNLQSIRLKQNGATGKFNGFIFLVEHPWQHGLWSTISYERNWNADDAQQGSVAYGDQSFYTPEYAYNLKRDWGNDGVDVPQDILVNTTAEVPVGKGKYLASNANWLLNGFIGNWSLTATYNWHSGDWFTVVESGIDPGNLGNTSSRRVDQVPGCNPYAGARNYNSRMWFSPACFTAPPNGQLGTVPINSLAGPSEYQLILDPYKEFPLGFREGAKLRIGAQIFNALNHWNLNPPVNDLSSAVAGQLTSAAVFVRNTDFGGGREISFNGKIIF